MRIGPALLLLGFLLASPAVTTACSMFKVTQGSRTMVGNNEDAWATYCHLNFVAADDEGFGYAYLTNDSPFPQGGINEMGLVFDCLYTHYQAPKPLTEHRLRIDPNTLLHLTMQHCSTVDEVAILMNKHDRGTLVTGIYFFVDQNGDYLLVESDTMLRGNDALFAVTNFRPSNPAPGKFHLDRYEKAMRILNERGDTSVAFCTSLIDTLSQCNGELGDGTLFSSLYDLEQGLIHLYFYHDFEHRVTLNLATELSLDDHAYLIESLFPPNQEFEALKSYITPTNHRGMKGFVIGSAIILFCSSAYFFFGLFRYRKKNQSAPAKRHHHGLRLLIITISAVVCFLAPLLLLQEVIYYVGLSSLPGNSPFGSELAYLPPIIAFLFIPVVWLAIRVFRTKAWSKVSRTVLLANVGALGLMICFYGYWGLLIPK